MKNNLDFTITELFSPVVFRSDFNSFKIINVSQAWSLLFTGGREDKELGSSPQVGVFFTTALLALVASGVAGTLIFTKERGESPWLSYMGMKPAAVSTAGKSINL